MKRSRSYRSHQKNKRIVKIIERYRWHNWFEKYSDQEKLMAKKEADNPKRPQCECCCNPRRSKLNRYRRYNKLTNQEKKNLDSVKDNLEELEEKVEQ